MINNPITDFNKLNDKQKDLVIRFLEQELIKLI